MIRFLYNLLFPLGFLFFLPGYLLKMRRRGNFRRNFGQRFGIYDQQTRARLAGRALTWMHAVSVGEVSIALKLAKEIRALDSSFECVLTTTTTTGYAVAEREAPGWMMVLYNPLDFWPIVRRAFVSIQPVRLILVEAEVWPNLTAIARARHIPISLINARLSLRSERRFRRFRALAAPTFRNLDLVCVQEPEDVERWAAIGVPRSKIEVVGSVKFDPIEAPPQTRAPFEILHSLGIAETRPILVGGSTHPGEEEILAKVWLSLRKDFPELFLVVAPRHVERAREVRQSLSTLGLRVALRSEIRDSLSEPADCLLLDTTGELRLWYSVATVVFIGKSLTTTGGQNPVEPILAHKPVIVGPHMENFAVLSRALLAHHGAIQINNVDELTKAVAQLLRDPEARRQLVERAHKVLAPHRGATRRTAELVLARKSQA
ncbi:MAG: 3-deoxy-D-manno-octulosonic acid transferase [Chthoniobacterales bacterium]